CFPSDPIIDPARAFVLIREKSPAPRPRIRTTNENLPSECLASDVRHFVYSATYSPTQPRHTSTSETYSQYSHISDHLAADATSEGPKTILAHQRGTFGGGPSSPRINSIIGRHSDRLTRTTI